MKQIGYYAMDSDDNLFRFEWGANGEFYIFMPTENCETKKIECDPELFDIYEIGHFTAES